MTATRRGSLTLPVALALAGVAGALSGCPGDGASGAGGPTSAPTTSTTPTTAATASAARGWAAQADRVGRGLALVVSKLESGDKKGALAERERTYFEEYENAAWNIEVASRQRLGEEPLDGRMRNVAQVREDAFAQLKGLIVHDEPIEKVRKAASELTAKVREDARALDEMKAPPP
ncbi:hypothetical protein HY251_15020 [bacterium]|nr:hypothetical protein [bacterium]